MTRAVSAVLAAAAITAFAMTAQAAKPANVCQWTGSGWACGDGNIFTQHLPPTPDMIITPVPTVPSNEKPLLSGPRPQ